MISIYELKPKFQQLLMPLVNNLHKHHVTPNQVTISACLLSIITGVLFYFNYDSRWIYIIIPLFMFVRMAMNAIDGVLAKKFNLTSRLGKFLNELTDVISDTALFILFFWSLKLFRQVLLFSSHSQLLVRWRESFRKLHQESGATMDRWEKATVLS